MKLLSLSFLIFGVIVVVSSASPVEIEKDRSRGLVKSDNAEEREKPLQRRKPPGKIPGPKLTSEYEESKMKSLSDEDRGRQQKGDNKSKKHVHLTTSDGGHSKGKDQGKRKDGHLVSGDGTPAEGGEETQEEAAAPCVSE